MNHRATRGRHRPAWTVAALIVFALALIGPPTALPIGNVTDELSAFPNIDARAGRVSPSAEQLAIVQSLGASATWNRFGTPQTLIKYDGGFLATGLSGTPVEAARAWIRANKVLFRLSDADVTNLDVLTNASLVNTPGRAVTFGQTIAGLPAAHDGLITVGIREGNVFYAASSAAGNQGTPASAVLSPVQAWLAAAANVGRPTSVTSVSNIRKEDGWTVFSVDGFYTPLRTGLKADGLVDQRARLVALPMPGGTARAAYETLVIDAQTGRHLGSMAYVDARTGGVLVRINEVMNIASGPQVRKRALTPMQGTFTGTTPNVGKCDATNEHPIPVQAETATIDVFASAVIPADDIVLLLIDSLGTTVASADTLFSPEAIHYNVPPAHPVGTWKAKVCEFEDVAGFDYFGGWATQDIGPPSATNFPAWRFFGANPLTGNDFTPIFDYPETDARLSACWRSGVPVTPACNYILDPPTAPNLAARAPWDWIVQTNMPSFTTLGNAANTAEAWTTFLTPGAFGQRPIDTPDRTYGYDDTTATPFETWTNQWNNGVVTPVTLGACPYPGALVPGHPQANDVRAAVTNLFAGHNRHHDWTYYLGFREETFNAQVNNFGRGGMENDPEIGNVQNGALLPAAAGLTRDNANQFVVPDGVPGITNQFLFQPLVGFYAPCVDGDYDAPVYGHEYNHLVHNRMANGPTSGLNGSEHGGALSESYSDQTGIEYTLEYNFVPAGQNPFAVGVYVTGNNETAIRNYELGTTGDAIGPGNPLNFSNYGYDLAFGGPEIHADGELWNAVNVDIRQALVAKYNGQFPASNAALQKRCADGVNPAEFCPGNRRWMQLQFDSYLLFATAAPSLLDARNAFLAADINRFSGANLPEIWKAFAQRGFGQSAAAVDGDDVNPTPGFDSPIHSETNVTFKVQAADQGNAAVPAQIFVGHYEGGDTQGAATEVADTDSSTALGPTAKFVAGTYPLVIRAKGYGMWRFSMTVSGTGTTTKTFNVVRNWASSTNSATATGPGDPTALLDDTENTSWVATDVAGGNISDTQPAVIIDLGGTQTHTVRFARVSAVGNGGRFASLRRFMLQTCVKAAANMCTLPANFTTIYTSQTNAGPGCVIGVPCPQTSVPFPGDAPRPIVPALLFREFDVPDTPATHVRLVVLDNQCTGGPEYQGDQDPGDPANNPSCKENSASNDDIRAAEVEIFTSTAGGGGGTQPPPPPPPSPPPPNGDDCDEDDDLRLTGPATAKPGTNVTYTITYTNKGGRDDDDCEIDDLLAQGTSFVSATGGGTWDSTTRTVTWHTGRVAAGQSKTVTVTAKVSKSTAAGTSLVNQATIANSLTVTMTTVVVK